VGLPFPTTPPADSDDPTVSYRTSDRSILGADSAGNARRLLTDSDRNLLVHVAQDDSAEGLEVTPLVTGAATSVPAATPTTLATYTAASATKVSRVSCSGTVYAKFQLYLNTVLIETRRTGPDRTIDFPFEAPLSLAVSDILDVKVTHYQTSLMENFETTIYGG